MPTDSEDLSDSPTFRAVVKINREWSDYNFTPSHFDVNEKDGIELWCFFSFANKCSAYILISNMDDDEENLDYVRMKVSVDPNTFDEQFENAFTESELKQAKRCYKNSIFLLRAMPHMKYVQDRHDTTLERQFKPEDSLEVISDEFRKCIAYLESLWGKIVVAPHRHHRKSTSKTDT